MTASVTPIGVIRPSHMKPSNVTSIAVEQLLGDERPEAPPLEGDVVRRHGVDVGARLGERGGVVGRPVASVCQLREVGR